MIQFKIFHWLISIMVYEQLYHNTLHNLLPPPHTRIPARHAQITFADCSSSFMYPITTLARNAHFCQ